jgi:HEAT repeat protein
MKKRRSWWLAGGLALAVLLGAVFLAPASPLNLPDWLGFNGKYDGRPTRSWMKDLDSDTDQTRWEAAFALGAMGTDGRRAVPRLATLMVEDPNARVRAAAALALAKMAPASRSGVAELIEALDDDEPLVRFNAVMALSRLGTEASEATPALIRALRDERNQIGLERVHFTIQHHVVVALGHTSAGSDEAVGPLLEVLKSAEDEPLKLAVVRSLGEIGPEARAAVPLLVPLLGKEPQDVRLEASQALAKIGWKGEDAEQGKVEQKPSQSGPRVRK